MYDVMDSTSRIHPHPAIRNRSSSIVTTFIRSLSRRSIVECRLLCRIASADCDTRVASGRPREMTNGARGRDAFRTRATRSSPSPPPLLLNGPPLRFTRRHNEKILGGSWPPHPISFSLLFSPAVEVLYEFREMHHRSRARKGYPECREEAQSRQMSGSRRID